MKRDRTPSKEKKQNWLHRDFYSRETAIASQHPPSMRVPCVRSNLCVWLRDARQRSEGKEKQPISLVLVFPTGSQTLLVC